MDFEAMYWNLLEKAVRENRSADIQGVIELLRARVAAHPEVGPDGPRETARLLAGLGTALTDRQDLDGACAALDEAERIARSLDDRALLAQCLEARTLALRSRGDVAAASASYSEQAKLYRALGDHANLKRVLTGHADVFLKAGDSARAAPLIREQQALDHEGSDARARTRTLGLEAQAAAMRGDLTKALALHEEEERIAREADDPRLIAQAIGNRGRMLLALNRLEESRTLLEEQERRCRELGDRVALANALGSLALVIQTPGDRAGLTRALALHRESAGICREENDHDGLAKGLAMQAQILAQIGRAAEGIPLVEEARSVAESHGLGHLVPQMIGPVQDYVRESAGRSAPAGLGRGSFWKRLFGRRPVP